MINFARKFLDMQSIEMIIPVPLHSTKLRQRQFNQAELLAKSLSKAFSKELNNKLLLKIKPAPAQVDLSGAKRLKNVRGTFKVKNTDSLKNKNLLIVDDVFTTGATVNECAKMLTDAGANRVEVLALARSI
jgi:competence protein ComFC